MSAPAVTVVIPTRNRRAMLQLTLQSVLAQRDVEMHIVVVDEGSSDGTRDYLRSLEDQRVSVLRNDEPEGLPAARNAGLAAARTRWIAFLDDDDLWAPDKLATQLASMQQTPATQWCCASALQIDEQSRVLGAERLSSGSDILRRLLVGNVIPGGGSGVLARTELLRKVGGFLDEAGPAADWECWIRLAQQSPVAVVDRPLLAYRLWAGSMSHDTRRMEVAQRLVRTLHAGLAADLGVDPNPETLERYLFRLNMRSGQGRSHARRLVGFAVQSRRAPLLALAAGVAISPRGVECIRRTAWRLSTDPRWIAEGKRWIQHVGRGDAAPLPQQQTRPVIACLAWTYAVGYDDIARAVGGEARVFSPSRGAAVGWRYASAAVRMGAYLLYRRPQVVIVTSPPVFAVAAAALYRRLTNARIVIDSHPGIFGLRERRWKLFIPLQRALIRRATATLVTSPGLATIVQRWRGRPVVFHEAPPTWTVQRPKPCHDPPTILFVTTFDPDEPIREIVAATHALVGMRVKITGRLPQKYEHLATSASQSTTFTGWLDSEQFRQAVDTSDVVVCLTDDVESVQRGATEAVYAERVLVHSDYPVGRRYFPVAIFCRNDAASIAHAVRRAVDEHDVYRRLLPDARQAQEHAWFGQLQGLLRLLGLDDEALLRCGGQRSADLLVSLP